MLKIEAADVPRLHVAVAMYADLYIMLVQRKDRLQGRRRETHIDWIASWSSSGNAYRQFMGNATVS